MNVSVFALVAAPQEAVAAALVSPQPGPPPWFEIGPTRRGWTCVWGADGADETETTLRVLLDPRVLPGVPDVVVVDEVWGPSTGNEADHSDEWEGACPGFRVDVRLGGAQISRTAWPAPRGDLDRQAVAELLVRLFGDVPGHGSQPARVIQHRDAVSAVDHALSVSLGHVVELVDRLGFLLPRLPPTTAPAPDRAVLLHRSTSRVRRRSVDASSRWGRTIQATRLGGGWSAYQLRLPADGPADVPDDVPAGEVPAGRHPPAGYLDPTADLERVAAFAAGAARGDTVVLLQRGPGTARADVIVAGRRHVRTWDGWLRSAERDDDVPRVLDMPADGSATDPHELVAHALGIPVRGLLILEAPCVAAYDEVRAPVSILRVLVARLGP